MRLAAAATQSDPTAKKVTAPMRESSPVLGRLPCPSLEEAFFATSPRLPLCTFGLLETPSALYALGLLGFGALGLFESCSPSSLGLGATSLALFVTVKT